VQPATKFSGVSVNELPTTPELGLTLTDCATCADAVRTDTSEGPTVAAAATTATSATSPTAPLRSRKRRPTAFRALRLSPDTAVDYARPVIQLPPTATTGPATNGAAVRPSTASAMQNCTSHAERASSVRFGPLRWKVNDENASTLP
jgi:hypothetical protein